MVYLKHEKRKRYQDKWQVKCRRNRAGDKSKSAEEDAFFPIEKLVFLRAMEIYWSWSKMWIKYDKYDLNTLLFYILMLVLTRDKTNFIILQKVEYKF